MSKCWQCAQSLEGPIMCNACGAIQPLSPVNPFDYLGLPVKYDIDMNALTMIYLKRQQHIHPDKVIHKPAEERLYAQQHSASLNEFYSKLKDPVARAEAILQYQGHPLDPADFTIQDPLLLQESLEHREKLMDLNDENDLKKFKDEIANLLTTAIKDLGANLDIHQDYPKAKTHLLRIKYLKKLMNEIHQKESL